MKILNYKLQLFNSLCQGLKRGYKKLHKALDKVLEKIIKEHEQADNVDKGRHKDFIDILLSMMHQPMDPQNEQNHVIDRTNTKAVVLGMIVGSIDTTAIVIQWALSELLRHPRVMKIHQDVIENEVGMRRIVADLNKLSHLDTVVNETLRLYPVGPLLLRRESQVIINAWTIG